MWSLIVDFLHVSTVVQGVRSKATVSVRMPVANVAEHMPQLTYDECVKLLAEAYHEYCADDHNVSFGTLLSETRMRFRLMLSSIRRRHEMIFFVEYLGNY